MGPYRLARKIGEGGMGAVYEALDIERGRRVAVKVLLRGRLDAADAVSRFFNEAKAVTAVSHPGLVTIYEHGKSSAGEPYIAMEFLEGESLRARHERQYLGKSALDFVRQLAQALAAIHTKRIVHRDLKPENVMLVADPAQAGHERTKLLDFGVAKLLGDPGGGSEGKFVKTRTGALIGTPMYMSPEQCRAQTAPDEKSDVYSLGVIFYELLSGEPPFMSESAGELYAMHIFAPVVDILQRVPGLDERLGRLIGRMLAKTPAERPTMDEVVAALEPLTATGLADGPLEQRPSILRRGGSVPEVAAASGMIRAQLAQAKTAPPVAAATTSGGEKVSRAVPTERRSWPLALGLGFAGVAVAAALLFGLGRRPRPAATRPPASVTTPAALDTRPAAPTPAPPGPAPTPAPTPSPTAAEADAKAADTAAKKPETTAPGGKHPTKGARKSGRKNGKYQVEFWQ